MKLFIVIFLAYSWISPAEELSSPLFLSQGGAGGASLQEDFSYLINPATMGFQKRTKGVIAYSFKKHNHRAVLSFLDMKTRFPLALTYRRSWAHSFSKSKKELMTFSSGLKVSPYLSFGFNVEKELNPSVWNGGLGSVFRMGNQLSMALFLNNILRKENKNQRILSLAFYYNWKHFLSAKADISKSARQEWIFRGGFESLFKNFLSVRLGGTWFQKAEYGLISGGLAFHSSRLFLEYSVETDQKTYQQAVILSLQI